ncbi:MAG: hypothetical protein ACLQVD_04965 [Capsulimonadaceae bacterium]
MNNKPVNTTETGQPPVAKLRIGLLSASIRQRPTDDNVYYSASFGRRYRDAQDNRQSAHSYDTDDLLNLANNARERIGQRACLREIAVQVAVAA